jgi:glycine/D-amino acid oxidase-like deaminating enzyme
MKNSLIIGQGITGSVLAWSLHWEGKTVHVFDRGWHVTASRIAAGLVTPFTGRRLSKAGDFDESQTVAKEFYRRVEKETGASLFKEEPAVRYFQDDVERDFFLKERYEINRSEIELINGAKGGAIGFRMLGAARLRVSTFLEVTRSFLAEKGSFHQVELDPTKDIEVSESGVLLPKLGLVGQEIYFCQGYQPEENPWFPGIPDAAARGEILRLDIPGRTASEVVHRGFWLAPATDQREDSSAKEYLLGATYDRDNLDQKETQSGRDELLRGLKEITNESYRVIGHYSAIRAGMKTRRPIKARHPKYPHVAIMNGMGSKASLMAPITAQRLLNLMALKQETKGQETRVTGTKAISLTKLAHSIARRAVRTGDTVVDATAGNGHDTVFLAACTGPSGHVHAIDIQQEAIQSTRSRLETESVEHVTLHQDDHSKVLKSLLASSEVVGAIMFNLGYLPGGNKQRTTSAATTTEAIAAGVSLLRAGGVMTVIAYRGHAGGQEEARAVADWSENNKAPSWTTEVIPGAADNEESPVLYVFRKKQ